MPTRRPIPNLKRSPPRNYLREWRTHRGYTLDDVVDRLFVMFGAETTSATISRIETSKQALDTGWLEMFAAVMMCHPADIISRPPDKDPGVNEVWSQIPNQDKDQALRVLRSFIPPKTGT